MKCTLQETVLMKYKTIFFGIGIFKRIVPMVGNLVRICLDDQLALTLANITKLL